MTVGARKLKHVRPDIACSATPARDVCFACTRMAKPSLLEDMVARSTARSPPTNGRLTLHEQVSCGGNRAALRSLRQPSAHPEGTTTYDQYDQSRPFTEPCVAIQDLKNSLRPQRLPTQAKSSADILPEAKQTRIAIVMR